MGADDDDAARLIISEAFLFDSSLQVRETSIASCIVNTFVVVVVEAKIGDRLIRRGSLLPLSDLLPCNKNILAELSWAQQQHSLPLIFFSCSFLDIFIEEISLLLRPYMSLYSHKMKDSIKVTFLGPLASFSHQVCNFLNSFQVRKLTSQLMRTGCH